MDDFEIEELVKQAKKIMPLRNVTVGRLAKWYWLVGKKDKEFGFREANGMEQQIEMAIEFLLRTEREWQDRIRENKTSLTFPLYFEYKARAEDIALPTDFQDKIGGKDEF